MVRFLIHCSLAFALLSGCRSAAPRPEPKAQSSPIEVTVKHLNKSEWRVSYKLPHKTKKIYFTRGPSTFRHEVFKPETTFFRWKIEDGEETISREDNAAFDSVSFVVSPYTEILLRDYQFTIAFADGSAALYTGHLDVGFQSRMRWPAQFVFEPRMKEKLVFSGGVYTSPTKWEPGPVIWSLYAYFGTIEPKITSASTSLVDPGLPAWLKPFADQSLPDVFKYYESVFKYRPSPPPFIIANVGNLTDPKNTRAVGGSAVGWIQFGLKGAQWKKPERGLREKFLFLFAHEGMHQFQGRPIDDFAKVGWLVEGGADFFSNHALFKLNLLTAKELKRSMGQSANQCIDLWAKDPIVLNAPRPDSNYQIVYGCGRILHESVHAILLRSSPDGLIDLWRELLVKAGSQDIDPEWYFDELATRSKSDAIAAFARAFVTETTKNPRVAVTKLLDAAGLRYRIVKNRIEFE